VSVRIEIGRLGFGEKRYIKNEKERERE